MYNCTVYTHITDLHNAFLSVLFCFAPFHLQFACAVTTKECLRCTTWYLQAIVSIKRGAGRALMQNILHYADTANPREAIKLTCVPGALEAYYRQFGFERDRTDPDYEYLRTLVAVMKRPAQVFINGDQQRPCDIL